MSGNTKALMRSTCRYWITKRRFAQRRWRELDAKVTEKKSEIAALDQQAEQAQAEVKEIEAVLATVEKQQVKIAEIEKVQPRDLR